MIDGRAVQTKTMNIVMDPEVQLTGVARTAYNTLVMDLHEAQRKGSETASRLTALNNELARVAGQVDSSTIGDATKTQFRTLRSQLDLARAKFGLTTAAVGGGGRGGATGAAADGRGGAEDGGRAGGAGATAAVPAAGADAAAAFAAQALANTQANALGRVSTAKNAVQNSWETPSAAVVKQATEAKTALTLAMTEASGVLARARLLAPQLGRANVRMTVPPPGQ